MTRRQISSDAISLKISYLIKGVYKMTTTGLTAANSLVEQIKSSTLAKIVLCSFLIALSAQVSLPLPFTPVPLTLQTLAVFAVGAMLGPKKGVLSILTYLGEATLGLPVLAGGAMNPLALIGPRGGYLVGYIALAFLAGWCIQNIQKLGKIGLSVAIATGFALVLAIGTLWLGFYVGMGNAYALGFAPFIPGELLKIMAIMACVVRYESFKKA